MRIKINKLRPVVEASIEAALPELRSEIEVGVKKGLESLNVERISAIETRHIMDDLIRKEIHKIIREKANALARGTIRNAVGPLIESWFKEWLGGLERAGALRDGSIDLTHPGARTDPEELR